MRFSWRLRLATTIILSFVSAAVFPEQQRTVVRLKSRDLIIHKEGVSRNFVAELRRTDLPRLHAFVQLRQPADRELAQALREDLVPGIHAAQRRRAREKFVRDNLYATDGKSGERVRALIESLAHKPSP